MGCSVADTADKATLTRRRDRESRLPADFEVALDIDEHSVMTKAGIAPNLNVRDLLGSWKGTTEAPAVRQPVTGTVENR